MQDNHISLKNERKDEMGLKLKLNYNYNEYHFNIGIWFSQFQVLTYVYIIASIVINNGGNFITWWGEGFRLKSNFNAKSKCILAILHCDSRKPQRNCS
jgi:hypothetical protein